MLQKRQEKQQAMELVIIDQLVPQEHLLRKIDRSVDFSFIRKLCEPLYCMDNGRPAIEPEVLFRMLFVGYLYGIRSERRLEEEINYNIAYKWFCGLCITEKAPDATTLSVNRKRRFRDNEIPEQIFNEILRQAIEKKLVGGEILYTDSTHIKAKANKHKKQTVTVEQTPKAYMEELDAAIERDRQTLGKKPFEKKDDEGPPTSSIQQSRNDPQSGQLHKEGKPDGFHYSEHRTVDSKNNVIVNVRITPANINDVDPVPEILDDIEKRFGKPPKYMGVDAGYHSAATCHQIVSWGIQPVVGYRRHTHKGEHYGKYRFGYDPVRNVYICPEKHELTWRTTNREGYREYWSDARDCRNCPRRSDCLRDNATRRLVTRHVWQDDLDKADAFTKTPNGKRIYAWRKETIERSFAEAKELHGLRYARMLGIRNMYEQSFLTAAVQNMKRIARALCFFFFPLPARFWICKSPVLS
jgi:transposase